MYQIIAFEHRMTAIRDTRSTIKLGDTSRGLKLGRSTPEISSYFSWNLLAPHNATALPAAMPDTKAEARGERTDDAAEW
ncbi:hypothetical protein [Catenuloplanes indicus]|uniref:Uncharacterized protein n=1 Tax=Catenuloplanes indicus TaxID=137267 RepID=A0AAE3W256_9ACTN|nr:hypothetical protein [Catenuloplanes indicus]MDQ0368518.1 hypothetical protein [Catenuloplanes indicus]